MNNQNNTEKKFLSEEEFKKEFKKLKEISIKTTNPELKKKVNKEMWELIKRRKVPNWRFI